MLLLFPMLPSFTWDTHRLRGPSELNAYATLTDARFFFDKNLNVGFLRASPVGPLSEGHQTSCSLEDRVGHLTSGVSPRSVKQNPIYLRRSTNEKCFPSSERQVGWRWPDRDKNLRGSFGKQSKWERPREKQGSLCHGKDDLSWPQTVLSDTYLSHSYSDERTHLWGGRVPVIYEESPL